MRHLAAALVASAAALTACADQPAQPVQLAATATPAKQVCSREVRTGSNVATSVCRRAGDGEGADTVDDFKNESQTTLNRTNGGFGR